MVFGRLTTRPVRAVSRMISGARWRLFSASVLIAVSAYPAGVRAQFSCEKPVYLTLDTGHMGIAHLVAQVLARQQVVVTFFAANEPTQQGDGSLGSYWSAWWRDRAAEGHAFASHTWNHT